MATDLTFKQAFEEDAKRKRAKAKERRAAKAAEVEWIAAKLDIETPQSAAEAKREYIKSQIGRQTGRREAAIRDVLNATERIKDANTKISLYKRAMARVGKPFSGTVGELRKKTRKIELED